MDAPVCLVAGVGPEKGTGAEIARRFAVGGYRVAMLARDGDRLADLEGKIAGTKSFPCDIADPEALVATVAKIRNDLGAPAVMVHNAPRSVRGAFLEVDPAELEKNFRVNVTALLYLARETLPAMVEAGKGVILVTGNTGATRGKATHGFFSSTKAAQRNLAESIAREFSPQGVHVAYFIVDAAISTPRTRPQMFPDAPDEFFAHPTAIAEEMYHVAHQDPSTWSFRVELRPFAEVW
ncbi:MAG: SDR family NAD(P)-dependent oxidoreductase [Rhodospirillaceae bacterium]|nr:SDR family NAD(P)-dependent oxidoreductase [Rhodospirillaceae bacterium]